MAIKVAINGYGRIGRNILKALYESGRTSEIQIVAINDLGDAETNAHLTRYDTAHGKFPFPVEVDNGYLVINGDRIKVLAERDPSKLPWKDLGVDVVHESTGFFTSKIGIADLDYKGNTFVPKWTGAPKEALDHLGVSYEPLNKWYTESM